MRLQLLSLGTLLLAFPHSESKPACPLYGPLLPRPTNLLQNVAIQAAAAALDDVFVQHIDADNSTGSDRFSYAVEVFAGSEDNPLWSHYWTAPTLRDFNSSGMSKVDTNTVFRIGSITKIFTVLTFLAAVGDGIWNDPITKHLPEIAELSSRASSSPIYTPDWESITIGSLASQTSGLIRDYALLGELSYQLDLTDLYRIGFPPLNVSEYPPCGSWPTCDREQLFAGLAKLPPSFPPFATPAYSDIGFVLLSFVAERISGKDFKTLVTELVLKPLGLSHTFLDAPDDSLGIIPGTRRATLWGAELGEEAATGNMYTSAGDLSSLGRAILRSTLLKPAMTRRWLKPAAFSSDPRAMVGMPWGIRRIDLGQNQTYQFVHTFNKLGSLGAYSSLLAVIPELDIGFTVLAAGIPPAGLTAAVAETLTATYVPTLSYVARAQANATFAGHYRHASLLSDSVNSSTPSSSSSSSSLPSSSATLGTPSRFLNSSLTIAVDPAGGPGLAVTSWLSNGTDMARVAVALAGNVSAEYIGRLRPSVRLYPTGLEEEEQVEGDETEGDSGGGGGRGGERGDGERAQSGRSAGGGKIRRVAFKAVFEDLGLAPSPGDTDADMPAEAGTTGSFVTDCATWVGVTGVVYASRPLDMFVFEFGPDGAVRAVVNEGLRVRLEKV